MKGNIVFFKLKLEKDLRIRLKKQSAINETTMNNLINEYIEEGLKRE